jgi:hypothetical protein
VVAEGGLVDRLRPVDVPDEALRVVRQPFVDPRAQAPGNEKPRGPTTRPVAQVMTGTWEIVGEEINS